MPLKIGLLLDERYRITSRIGHGGMSEVYEAMDIITRKVVAIKLLREDIMVNPINFRHFQNEATIAASLNHPNIVKVYGHGSIDGRPYIINEYIPGQTIKDTLDFRSALPIPEAISIMLQLSSALYYAHQHGVIHRDIKPLNLFIMSDGTIKLGDFGIAETNDLKFSSQSKDIVGSVHYLAPEISKGKPASVSSDIYATGVTFFELITGHVPFSYDDPVAIAVAHIKEKFPSPSKYLPNCSREVEKIIMKCVEKDPKDRYASALELYEDLLMLQKHPEFMKEKKSWLARFFGFK